VPKDATKKKGGKMKRKKTKGPQGKMRTIPVTDISSAKWNGSHVPMLGHKYNMANLKDDEKVNSEVRSTRDYSKFVILPDNRDTDDVHIAELVVNIRKRGQLQPIIINEKDEIIDGQTRFKACKLLGIPVMYLTSHKTTIKDVLLINTTQKPWSNRDYLKAYSHSNHWNHTEYKKVGTFIEKYALNFEISLMLLYGKPLTSSGSKGHTDFKQGNFKVHDLEKAERTANQLLKIKAFAPNLVKIGKFCKAFLRVQALKDFSILIAYEQLEKNTNQFDKCNNQEDWNEAFIKAYNFNLRKKHKRISIKKEGF
tara:strand:- start:20 stop:949 length:930 start_codon:yes stop_codon:yes gene_type:complete